MKGQKKSQRLVDTHAAAVYHSRRCEITLLRRNHTWQLEMDSDRSR